MIRSIWKCSEKQIILMNDNDPQLTLYPAMYNSHKTVGNTRMA